MTLQKDIDELNAWSDSTRVLTLGKYIKIRHTHRYTLYDDGLENVFAENDKINPTLLNFP